MYTHTCECTSVHLPQLVQFCRYMLYQAQFSQLATHRTVKRRKGGALDRLKPLPLARGDNIEVCKSCVCRLV